MYPKDTSPISESDIVRWGYIEPKPNIDPYIRISTLLKYSMGKQLN